MRLSLLLLSELLAGLCLTGLPAWAHVISMSTGDAMVRGKRIEYILHMPEYEMRANVDPTTALVGLIKFRSYGVPAKRLDAECHRDASRQEFLCAADYEFETVPGDIDVECRFFEATVSNHVHMLRAVRGDKFDRVILDVTFPKAALTFRTLTPAEIAVSQLWAGALRLYTSLAQILLLAAMAFAARSRLEWLFVATAYVGAQALSAVWVGTLASAPSSRFAETAVALALAYLGIELALWPQSGGRWLLALLFGAFGGTYFAWFVRESGYSPVWVLSGCSLATITVLGVCSTAGMMLRKISFIPAVGRVAAWSLFVFGIIWFAVRVQT